MARSFTLGPASILHRIHKSLHEGSLTFLFVSPCFSMRKTIERYREHVKKDENCIPETEVNTQYLGQDLVSCSLDEVIELDSKLEHALRIIRERKVQCYVC
ncbi:putative transcription factor, K-box [Helianthus anomalus]